MKTPKDEVLAVYPDAMCNWLSVDSIWCIHILPSRQIGKGLTMKLAWGNALDNINKNKKNV